MDDAVNPPRGNRVLIIEDESHVAMMLEVLLQDMGFEVAGMATRFGDAMAKARSLDFDVAVLDVNLDGEPSYPVAEAIAERGIGFVFATGYGADRLPESLRSHPVLQKPYRMGDLKQALQQVVERA